MTVATPAQADPLMDQKRQLSGELKTTRGMTDGLLKKAMDSVTNGKAEDHDKFMKIADGIKEVQAKIDDQLSLVNRATEKDSEGVFARAREVITSSKGSLEGFKKQLGVGADQTKEPVKEKPMTK